MSEPPSSRPQPFQPRFTLGLFYLAGFFFLYCLLFVAPQLFEVMRSVPPGPDQERLAAEAAQQAIRGKLLIALLASLATTALGTTTGWLPGMRPPR